MDRDLSGTLPRDKFAIDMDGESSKQVPEASIRLSRLQMQCEGCGDNVGLDEYGVCIGDCSGTVSKCFALKHLGDAGKLVSLMHNKVMSQKQIIQSGLRGKKK
eukprot:gene27066-33735_t